jgi:hemoglobin-like flavoprotein
VTPEQVEMVQLSFAQLGPRTSELASRFYERLFELEPSCRAMFSADPADQTALFASELAMTVASISDFDAFVTRTHRLGSRHLAYGVTHVHYVAASIALVEALAATLELAFTDEMQTAWRLAFDLMAETMMQGADEPPFSNGT